MIAYMNLFGDWLLYSSLRASLLVIIILAVRTIFLSRMSPRWRHLMWILLIVQMFLPWTPGSVISIDNLWTLFKVPTLQMQISPMNPVPQMQNLETAATVSSSSSSYSKIDWKMASFLSIWAVVSLAIAAGILYKSLQISSLLKRRRLITDSALLELLEDCKEKMDVHLPIGLVSAPGVESPMVVGFLRPLLALPEKVLNEFSLEEIRYIMLHELSHVKRHDIAVNWLMAVLQAIHWFNPFVWIAFRLMRSDSEQDCDMMAVGCTGYQENIRYGETIIKLLAGFNKPRFLPEIAGIMEDKEQMKTRISMIGQLGSRLRYSNMLAAGILALLAATSLTSAQVNSGKQNEKIESPQVKGDPLPSDIIKATMKKLDSIVIDRIAFQDTSINDVLDFLSKKSRELDTEKKGVNIILKMDPEQAKNPPAITILVEKIQLGKALDFTVKATGLKYQIDDTGAVIISK